MSMTSLFGSGSSYPVTQGAPPEPAPLLASAPASAFVGFYPDGSIYVSSASEA